MVRRIFGLANIIFLILFVSFKVYPESFKNKHHHSKNIQNQSVAKTKKTVIVYVVGLAGTGKYTIAKQISSRQKGYKLVDNHLIYNPIYSLLPNSPKTSSANKKVDEIREVVFDFIKEDTESNYILTNQLFDNSHYRHLYQKVKNVAAKKGSIFIPVKLVISYDEHAKRIASPERVSRFKLTKISAVNNEKVMDITDENVLVLDVTHLSPEKAAQKIMQHVNRIRNET